MGTAMIPYRSVAPASRFPKGAPQPDDIFGDVGTAQDYLREGTTAYGASLQPAILKEIGSTLGGLNSIGGLRSGGVPVALGEIGQKYADIIGQHAAQSTERGLEYGLEAHKQRFAEAEAKRRRKAGLLHAIGSVLGAGLGAGIGFAVGGPPGALKGVGLGQSLGGSLGEGGGDIAGGY